MIKTLRVKEDRRRPRQPSSVNAPKGFASLGGIGEEGYGEGQGEGGEVDRVVLSAKTGLPMGVLPERTFDDR